MMLFGIAAMTGSDRTSVASVYRHKSGTRSNATPWMGAYACCYVLGTNVEPTYAGRNCTTQRGWKTDRTKMITCVSCRRFQICSPFIRIHTVATNGRSVTYLPSASLRLRLPARAEKSASKKGGRSTVGRFLARYVAPYESLRRWHERVGECR
jgi:hypothetical protein